MADDELILGYWDSEWTGIAPILEEDVAMSSLAQDEIGHARALLGLLGELRGEDPDALAYDREVEALRHCRLLDHPRTDWAFTIARRYLYDEADAVRLEALADSTFTPLAELVAKIRREEVYHRMHASAWLRRLADDDGEARARLEAAWLALLPDAATVFTPLTGEARLVAAGRHRGAERRARGALAPGHRRHLSRARAGRARARRRTRRTVGRATAMRSAGCGTRRRWSAGSTRRRPGDRARGPPRPRPRSARRRNSAPRRSSTPASGRPWRRSPIRSCRSSPSSTSGSSVGSMRSPERIHVELLPTFVGCHALEVMQAAIADRLAGLATVVEVEPVFDPPWTSDRITAEGRRRLTTMGVAPPSAGGAVAHQPRRPARLSALRIVAHEAGERLRPDAVPHDPLLRLVSPAVRGLQAGLSDPGRVTRAA